MSQPLPISNQTSEDLLKSLLWRSVKDYLFYEKGRKLYQGAFVWLHETHKNPPLVSFEDVCETLCLDKDKVIFLLHEYKDKKKRNIEGEEWERFLEVCSSNGRNWYE